MHDGYENKLFTTVRQIKQSLALFNMRCALLDIRAFIAKKNIKNMEFTLFE